MDAKEARFVTGGLWRHVVVMSLTSSVGLTAIFAVDFVDMIFIAMLGNAALAAAVGYAGTVIFFTNSINIGLSIAAGALVSRAVGASHETEAREYATSVAIFGILTGIALPVLMLSNLGSLLDFLGATGEVRRLAIRYCGFVLPSMALMALAMTAMAVMRARGDAMWPMWVTLIGGTVNAALDPLFIFGLGLGLDGAAIATVCARLVLSGLAVGSVIRRHNGFALPRPDVLLRDLGPVSRLAFPAVLTNVATPVGAGIITRLMADYGTDAVAGMAIIARLTPVAFGVTLALSGAIGPIVGQNAGAGVPDRVRQAFFIALQFTAIYVVSATLALILMRGPLVVLFDAEGQTRDLLLLFCGPLALGMFFNGAIFVSNASLNNLGHPLYSTLVNWGRHSLGTWPFAALGGALLGVQGVLIGQALGGAVFAGIAIMLALHVMRNTDRIIHPAPFAGHRQFHKLLGRFGL